jgi:hypothetical protein
VGGPTVWRCSGHTVRTLGRRQARWAAAGGAHGAAAESPGSRGFVLGDGSADGPGWAAPWGKLLGLVGLRRDPRAGEGWGPGWAGWVEFGPWPIENWKKFFNFQILFKF